MDWNFLTEVQSYIPIFIIGICLLFARGLGWFLKNKTNKFDTKKIPYVVLITTIAVAVWVAMIFPSTRMQSGDLWQDIALNITMAVLVGFFAALASGGWNEWGKNFQELRDIKIEEDNPDEDGGDTNE